MRANLTESPVAALLPAGTEPISRRVRPTFMLADTSAIHAFGDARSRHAAALDAAHALLASAQPGDALGPVGAAFTRALCDALARHADRIGRLSALSTDAGALARATAATYDDADARLGRTLAVGA
jgi:hypothetical protein